MTEKHPKPLRRRLRPALAAVALALAGLAASGAPAMAVDDGTLGIRPQSESDFFHLDLAPGAAADATAIVSNHTGAPVTLLTYPVDGQNTAQGTFAFAGKDDQAKGIGSWVHLDAGQVTVPANTDLPVHFRLTVPQGTPPGDYAGGVIIQAPPVQGQTTTVHDTAVRIDTVQRQGVRIYLKVDGTPVKSQSHGTLAWAQDGPNLDFTLPVTNTGNTILHPTADLNLTGWPTNGAQAKFDTPEAVLPGATVDLHATLPGAPPAQTGTAEAKISSEAGTQDAAATVLYAPWLALGIALLALAAAAYGAWRLARFVHRARAALAQAAAAQSTGSWPAARPAQERTAQDGAAPAGRH